MKLRVTMAALLLVGQVTAVRAGAQASKPEEDPRWFKVADYKAPKEMAEKRTYYMEEFHSMVPSEKFVRTHPRPMVQHKGPTVRSAVEASQGEIQGLRAGLDSFQAELREMTSKASKGDGDAPNRYLLGQGWKVVRALSSVFNDKLVPAANALSDASEKGNQNLEILIMIAGGKAAAPELPRETQLAISGIEEQLIAEVKAHHTRAVAVRRSAGPLLSDALAQLGPIGEEIEKYDEAYVEYQRGTSGYSRLESGAAQTAESSLEGVIHAVTTGKAAEASLTEAESAEQNAIQAVEACIKGNKAAAQNPGDGAAQSNASNLNRIAQMEVQRANVARQTANGEVGGKPATSYVAGGADKEGSERVRFNASDSSNVGGVKRLATSGAQTLDVPKE